ncbi:MAG: hypothetical protein ABL877_05205 [Thiobacillus sp.]
MKSQLIKTTFAVLTFSALGLTSGAQADWGQRDYGWKQDDHRAAPFESQRLAREIDERLDRQEDRIKDGMRHGQLTKFEFRALMQNHSEMRHMQRAFMADGFMGPLEYRRLDRALDEARGQIAAEKHDREARAPYFAYHPHHN